VLKLVCQEHAEIGTSARRFLDPPEALRRESSENEIVARESAGLHLERYEGAAYISWARRAHTFPADFARRLPWNPKTETSHRGVRILKARGPNKECKHALLTPGRFRFESIHDGSCALHRYVTDLTHIFSCYSRQ
jgi:hypothetical protein